MTDKAQDDADVKARNEAVARERMYQEQRIKDRYINSLIREARQQGMREAAEIVRGLSPDAADGIAKAIEARADSE